MILLTLLRITYSFLAWSASRISQVMLFGCALNYVINEIIKHWIQIFVFCVSLRLCNRHCWFVRFDAL